jgi:hypothetical protein
VTARSQPQPISSTVTILADQFGGHAAITYVSTQDDDVIVLRHQNDESSPSVPSAIPVFLQNAPYVSAAGGKTVFNGTNLQDIKYVIIEGETYYPEAVENPSTSVVITIKPLNLPYPFADFHLADGNVPRYNLNYSGKHT